MATGDQRVVVLDGIPYTARVLGPAPWNKPKRRWWQFWRPRRIWIDDELTAEWIEFTGHPTPLRSKVRTAIKLDTLVTITDEQLVQKLEHALQMAQSPHGHDMVALTRGDERIVISWGDWRALCALLLACKFEMESYDGEISERDAKAVHELAVELQKHKDNVMGWPPQNLPGGFVEFLSGGPFSVVDIG